MLCHHRPMPTELLPVVLVLVLIALIWGGLVRESHARRFRQALDERPVQVEVPAPTPPRPIEERLTELDDLHRRGVISDEEHRAARARALADG